LRLAVTAVTAQGFFRLQVVRVVKAVTRPQSALGSQQAQIRFLCRLARPAETAGLLAMEIPSMLRQAMAVQGRRMDSALRAAVRLRFQQVRPAALAAMVFFCPAPVAPAEMSIFQMQWAVRHLAPLFYLSPQPAVSVERLATDRAMAVQAAMPHQY
jgi:hypothetical protein